MRIFRLSFIAVIIALAFSLPAFSQALTYQEIAPIQQTQNNQGKVLGAITPSPDINNDGIVNSLDFAIVKGHNGENYTPADLNKDGVVNSLDFSILSSWYFATK